MATGQEIKLLIRASGKTQAEIANIIGVSRQYLNKLFNYAEVDAEIEKKIKNAIGVTFVADIPVKNKDQAVELMRSALSRLEKLEADVQLLKLALLNKHENGQ